MEIQNYETNLDLIYNNEKPKSWKIRNFHSK